MIFVRFVKVNHLYVKLLEDKDIPSVESSYRNKSSSLPVTIAGVKSITLMRPEMLMLLPIWTDWDSSAVLPSLGKTA